MKKVIQLMKRSMLLLPVLFLFIASGYVVTAETTDGAEGVETAAKATDRPIKIKIITKAEGKNWKDGHTYVVGEKATYYFKGEVILEIIVPSLDLISESDTVQLKIALGDPDNTEETPSYDVISESDLKFGDSNYHFIYTIKPPADTTFYEEKYIIKGLIFGVAKDDGSFTPCRESVVDNVTYVLDNRYPQIDFCYPNMDTVTFSPESSGKKLYYTQAAQGEIKISDLNLNGKSVSVKNYNDTVKKSEKKDYIDADISEQSSKDVATEVVYPYKISKEGEYCLVVKAEDTLENEIAINGIIVLDLTAPDVSLSVSKENGSEVKSLEGKVFKEDLTITVEASDPNLDVSSLNLKINKRKANGQVENVEETEKQEWKAVKDSDGNVVKYTYSCKLSDDGEYSFKITVKDLAGNEAKKLDLEDQVFYIDKTSPVVSIGYDDTETKNDIYYRDARTATITVQDFTFQEDGVEFLITSEEGHSPVYGQWVHHKGGNCDGKQHTASCRYTMEVTFDKDDIYDVAVRCKDKAGNSSERVDGGHFVIDRTAPVILITYDQNKEDDGYFYNVTRTASIVITDLSFDKNAVVIGSAQWGYDDITQTGNWTDAGKRHTLPVVFDKDGNYQFTVTATDLAGNQAEVQTSEYFVIDKTAPTLTIQGVGDLLAYSEEVKPEIIYGDIYLDDSQTKINISGAKSGEAKIKYDKYPMRNGFSIMYRDFAYSEDWDDLYVLTASVQDMAGNVSEQSVMFSVNRYGSVYVPGEETRQMLDNYYIDGKTDLVISEINVDYLTATEITSSFNGEIKTLEAGRDYLVTAEGTEETWKTYRYVINSSNFEEDGYYVLTLSSKDKAENASDNRIKGTELRFAVDRTAPNMVVTGARNNDENSQDSMKMTVDVQDNMSMDSLSIYENDQLLWEFDREALQEKGGVVSFAVKEADETMPIRVCARDTAGNVREKSYASAADSIGGVDALMKNPVFIAALGLVVLMLIAGGLYGREVFVNKSKDKG